MSQSLLMRMCFLVTIALSLSACSKDEDSKDPGKGELASQGVQPVADLGSKPSALASMTEKSLSQVGCEDFRFQIFEQAQIYLLENNSVPDKAMLRSALEASVGKKWDGRLGQEGRQQLTAKLMELYQTLFEEAAQKTAAPNLRELKRTLGALKVGDRSSREATELQATISARLQAVSDVVSRSHLRCEGVEVATQETTAFSPIQEQALKLNTPLAVLGIRRTLATAYQSCQSLRLPPMTRAVPAIEGVEDAGPYPGGGGRFRKITDQAALARSHYYVRDFTPSPGCVDVKKATMIYDYGGKPFTTSDPRAGLNYWKNNSDGSKGLGIDCSGYVFSALAAGGLRLIKNRQLKPLEVEDYPARMYIDAAKNGFSCLEKAKMGKTFNLRPGDIAATKYHVVIVEKVGKDPLAIRKYANCNRITYSDFDFTVAQSSPEQNSIGINRYNAKEYLAQKFLNPIRSGFVDYARAACVAFQSGKDVASGTSDFGIVRHKMTPECLQPDVKLVGSACTDNCPELFE
jgi:hypothetical protein